MDVDRWLLIVRKRLQSLVDRGRLDREVDEELRDHIEQQIEANMRAGMSANAARRAAVRGLGGVEQRKEEIRETRGLSGLRTIARDVRFAVRMFRRRPGFSLVATATMALGIGASTAIFAVVNGVLLQPLPFPEPERLMLVSSAPEDRVFGRAVGLSEEHFLNFEARNTHFEAVAMFSSQPSVMTDAGDPIRIALSPVSSDFFAVFAVAPALGRTFGPGDGPAVNPVVVISDGLWRSNFGASRDAIGRIVTIDGTRHEVIGVMPSGFSFPEQASAWRPFPVAVQNGNYFIRSVVGRLRSGVSAVQAQAELQSLAPSPPDGSSWRTVVLPLKERAIGQFRRPLAILIAAVAAVLLVTCLNVANLFLVRMADRERELSVRMSLGAGRRRLLQQLLIESGVIAAAGVAAGVTFAAAVLPIVIDLAPGGVIPRRELIQIDGRVLAFAVILSVLTALAFGLLPAVRATRQLRLVGDVRRTLSRRHDWLQGSLVIVEVALSLVLLIGAGLLLKSFLRLQSVDTGFSTADAVSATVDLGGPRFKTAEALQDFHANALARLGALPDVRAVGVVNWLPLGTASLAGDVYLDGGRTVPRGYVVYKPAVNAGYFDAMGIRRSRGRAFTDADRASSMPVAIVSRTVAAELWPGEDALGQRLRLNDKSENWLTVVGIVDDVTQQTLGRERSRAVYLPYLQVTNVPLLTHMVYVVRTGSNAAVVVPAIRNAMRQVDAALPVPAIVPLANVVAARTAAPAFQARLISMFAATALFLTIVGIYGVLAYSVAERTREFGIRMALGARTSSVMRIVLERTALLGGTGLTIGVGASLLVTRALAGQLFEVTPTDPATFAIVILLIAVAAVAAALLPAWRAARVDPTVALRAE